MRINSLEIRIYNGFATTFFKANLSIMISTYLYLIVFQSIFSSVNPSTFRFFSSGILGNLMRPKYVAMCPKGKSENTKKLCF